MAEETALLKEYIKALESENQSKNTERSTLENQLTTILEENNKLREKISSLPTVKQLETYKKEIKQLKEVQRNIPKTEENK